VVARLRSWSRSSVLVLLLGRRRSGGRSGEDWSSGRRHRSVVRRAGGLGLSLLRGSSTMHHLSAGRKREPRSENVKSRSGKRERTKDDSLSLLRLSLRLRRLRSSRSLRAEVVLRERRLLRMMLLLTVGMHLDHRRRGKRKETKVSSNRVETRPRRRGREEHTCPEGTLPPC